MSALLKFLRKHIRLFLVLLALLFLVALFHDLMTPFIIALIIVYLIEPMVKRMHKIHIGKHHFPRGVAVLCAYLLFLLAMTGFGFALVPALTSEISQATDDLPKYYARIKDEEIPRLSQKADEILFKLSRHDKSDIPDAIKDAEGRVHHSIESAMKYVDEVKLPQVDTSGMKPLLVDGERAGDASAKVVVKSDDEKKNVLFKLHQLPKGDFEVISGDRDIMLQAKEDGSFVLKTTTDKDVTKTSNGFNLEREINKNIVGFVESSTQYAGSALSVIQSVIEFIVNTFIQFILVFMLAAFISIDSPKLISFVRSLFEDKDKKAPLFDEFKDRQAKGLAGVVRGQLIVCCIDGFLTGLGLWILGVNYALLLGIIGGLLCIIPIFGTIILMVPVVLLSFLSSSGDNAWVTAVASILLILVIHFCDTNFFTPKIVGKSSNLHPVIIIFALLVGQQIAGVLGLILAVPVTSMLKITFEFIIERAHKNEELEKEKALAEDENKREIALAAAHAAVQVMTEKCLVPVPAPVVSGVAGQGGTIAASDVQTHISYPLDMGQTAEMSMMNDREGMPPSVKDESSSKQDAENQDLVSEPAHRDEPIQDMAERQKHRDDAETSDISELPPSEDFSAELLADLERFKDQLGNSKASDTILMEGASDESEASTATSDDVTQSDEIQNS